MTDFDHAWRISAIPRGRIQKGERPCTLLYRQPHRGDVRGTPQPARRYGTVYVCYDHEFKEAVVLKTIQERFLQSKDKRDLFKREALAWVSLERHAYIVRAKWQRSTTIVSSWWPTLSLPMSKGGIPSPTT